MKIKLFKKTKKYFFTVLLVLLFFYILFPILCFAKEDEYIKTIFNPQITIPGSGFRAGEEVEIKESTQSISEYIKSIYSYLLAIVGLLAVIVLMASGIIWMTAAGNTERISQAKGWMTGSLTGLVLMLFSYIVLKTINPELTNFKISNIENVKEVKINMLVASKDQIPKDTRLATACVSRGYRCQNVSVDGKITSLITVEDDACIEYFGAEEWEERRQECVISSNGDNYLYCCGSSETEKNERNNFCKNKNDGTSCYMSMTDKLKTGYCENGQCKQCISGLDNKGAGQKCTKNYQCATDIAGSCGNESGGTCLFYIINIKGDYSDYGYCKIEYYENGCEGTVGGGCAMDSCCQGLCCSRAGIYPVCIPGQKIDGSNNCKYE